MIRIMIYEPPHKKDTATAQAIAEYTKRLSRIATIRYKKLAAAPPNALFFDPSGAQLTSPDLAERFASELLHGNELHLALGQPDAPEKDSIQLLSLPLSPGTESVLLLEQIYRSFKINSGEPYHK